ncbi:MAG TPA: GDP-mannose 4,6-dehydratase [Candidatus Eisenbacteria bacterium]|jgi:GDP-4-dehydro-6-deoxy-D-mannose reductase
MIRQRILVTGANGFVGPHLTRALAARGARVHGAALGAAPPGLALDGWHAADVRAPESLAAAIAAARPDAIVHLAGQSSAALSFEDPVATFQVNALGTWHLLEAVRRAAPRARVLVVGTSEAYGPRPEGTRVAEDAPFMPVSPYALSKAAADALAEVAHRTWGTDVVRTRSFAHAGPGQTTRFAIPSFAEQIASIEAGKADPVLRVGNLEVTRDLTDVRDVAEAYATLIERGRSGAAYNVCRGEGVRLRDVAQALASRSKVPVRIEVDPARFRPADVPYLVGDPSAIARDCGWRATTPLERTLDELLDEWRARARPA